MAIPIALTTVTIRRPDRTGDASVPPATPPQVIAEGVRAVIGAGGGTVVQGNGQRVTYSHRLTCDPCPAREGDLVEDLGTGARYRLVWAVARPGLGLDHVEGRLQHSVGAY